MRVSADGGLVSEGEQLAFLATTLDGLVLAPVRSRAGRRPDPASHSPIRRPIRCARCCPPSTAARTARAAGRRDSTARGIDIVTASQFVIDEEFFDPPEEGPLRLKPARS